MDIKDIDEFEQYFPCPEGVIYSFYYGRYVGVIDVYENQSGSSTQNIRLATWLKAKQIFKGESNES